MELQRINKEIALKLKELGFNWSVNHYYLYDTIEVQQCVSIRSDEPVDNITSNSNCLEKYYSAPTQALVVKWLRDVHKIRIFVQYSEANGTYKFEIRVPRTEDWKMERIGFISSFETYEQAEEAGIIEALKLIKIND